MSASLNSVVREQLTLPGSTSRALSQSGGWAAASWARPGSETGTSRPGTRSWGTLCGYQPSVGIREDGENKTRQTRREKDKGQLWAEFKSNVKSKTRLSSTFCYLTWWHQVKRVEQEKTEALDEEHIMAVFPHQEEGEGGGTHGEIAKHLERNSRCFFSAGGVHSRVQPQDLTVTEKPTPLLAMGKQCTPTHFGVKVV